MSVRMQENSRFRISLAVSQAQDLAAAAYNCPTVRGSMHSFFEQKTSVSESERAPQKPKVEFCVNCAT